MCRGGGSMRGAGEAGGRRAFLTAYWRSSLICAVSCASNCLSVSYGFTHGGFGFLGFTTFATTFATTTVATTGAGDGEGAGAGAGVRLAGSGAGAGADAGRGGCSLL